MNREAIERTKARCKKEIKGKDRLYVFPGFYVKKPKIPEWDATVDYADGTEVIWHDGSRVVVSGLNNHATINPKEAGVIVPREIYAAFGYMAAMSIASIVTLFVTGAWWWLS